MCYRAPFSMTWREFIDQTKEWEARVSVDWVPDQSSFSCSDKISEAVKCCSFTCCFWQTWRSFVGQSARTAQGQTQFAVRRTRGATTSAVESEITRPLRFCFQAPCLLAVFKLTHVKLLFLSAFRTLSLFSPARSLFFASKQPIVVKGVITRHWVDAAWYQR